MTKMTKELYDTLGPDETVNLHAWTSSKATSVDNTHTNIYGGTYNAYLVTKTIKELGVAGISEHITAKEAPVKLMYLSLILIIRKLNIQENLSRVNYGKMQEFSRVQYLEI